VLASNAQEQNGVNFEDCLATLPIKVKQMRAFALGNDERGREDCQFDCRF
jgi:hypothetical protein